MFETTLGTLGAPCLDNGYFFSPLIGCKTEIVYAFARQEGNKTEPGQPQQFSGLASRNAILLIQPQDDQFPGFFSGLKSFVNKVARGIQKGAAVASKVAPGIVAAIPELAPLAAALPAISGAAGVARGLSGGGLAGGRLAGGQIRRRRRRM